ncbi:hypothetical protein ACUNV4_00390 [Granulosicoccus sp. 3-233]
MKVSIDAEIMRLMNVSDVGLTASLCTQAARGAARIDCRHFNKQS